MGMSFEGKSILVTGANNPLGIGAATARAFALRGAKVALTYLKMPPLEERPVTTGLAFYNAAVRQICRRDRPVDNS